MRKIFVLAMMATVSLSFGSCADREIDEQMESAMVVNKSAKADKTQKVDKALTGKGADKNERNGIMLCAPNKTKTEKDPFAKDKNKNEKNGVMPISTRYVEMYVEDGPIRHPLIDGDPVSDKPANGGSSTQTSSKKKTSGPIAKPLK